MKDSDMEDSIKRVKNMKQTCRSVKAIEQHLDRIEKHAGNEGRKAIKGLIRSCKDELYYIDCEARMLGRMETTKVKLMVDGKRVINGAYSSVKISKSDETIDSSKFWTGESGISNYEIKKQQITINVTLARLINKTTGEVTILQGG